VEEVVEVICQEGAVQVDYLRVLLHLHKVLKYGLLWERVGQVKVEVEVMGQMAQILF
jgi:hypothetical protein